MNLVLFPYQLLNIALMEYSNLLFLRNPYVTFFTNTDWNLMTFIRQRTFLCRTTIANRPSTFSKNTILRYNWWTQIWYDKSDILNSFFIFTAYLQWCCRNPICFWSYIARKFQKNGRLHSWQVSDSVQSHVCKRNCKLIEIS